MTQLKKKINNKNKIVHRHGASPVYSQTYIKKNLKNNLNYKNIIFLQVLVVIL